MKIYAIEPRAGTPKSIFFLQMSKNSPLIRMVLQQIRAFIKVSWRICNKEYQLYLLYILVYSHHFVAKNLNERLYTSFHYVIKIVNKVKSNSNCIDYFANFLVKIMKFTIVSCCTQRLAGFCIYRLIGCCAQRFIGICLIYLIQYTTSMKTEAINSVETRLHPKMSSFISQTCLEY